MVSQFSEFSQVLGFKIFTKRFNVVYIILSRFEITWVFVLVRSPQAR